tara:strand:+ start:445 stop:891 length:447 start_codon:yes stop_codon:yes gene_type:complete
MAHVRISLDIEGKDDFRTEKGLGELTARLYDRLSELMEDNTLVFEKFYSGEQVPEFKLASHENAEKAVQNLRASLLWDQEPDLGSDLPPIAERYFILAINTLDTAAHYLHLTAQFEKLESAVKRHGTALRETEKALDIINPLKIQESA